MTKNDTIKNISGIYANLFGIFDNSYEHEICYLVSTQTNGCFKDEMNMLLKDFSKRIFRKKAESALLCKSKKGCLKVFTLTTLTFFCSFCMENSKGN